MSALQFLTKLLQVIPAIASAIESVGARISRRPPRIQMPPGTPIYHDAHSFSRESPNEPPPYCYYCRQLRSHASRYCPGMPPRELE